MEVAAVTRQNALTMGLDVQIRGLGLDEDFVGRRRYSFVVRSAHRLDAQLRIEFQDLLRAWYLIGFHGGFGGSLNRLRDVEYAEEREGENITFGVVGALTSHALDDLVRCLTDSDIDMIVESVVVTISEHD